MYLSIPRNQAVHAFNQLHSTNWASIHVFKKDTRRVGPWHTLDLVFKTSADWAAFHVFKQDARQVEKVHTSNHIFNQHTHHIEQVSSNPHPKTPISLLLETPSNRTNYSSFDKHYRISPALIRARQPFLKKSIFTALSLFSTAVGLCQFSSALLLPWPPPPSPLCLPLVFLIHNPPNIHIQKANQRENQMYGQ